MSTESVVARTLKRLYPHNPDVVLGREARVIVEELRTAGFLIVQTGCAHDFDPECARCNTLRPFRIDLLGECEGCGAVGRDPHHEECPF